jgi:hypothetical protein
MRGEIQVRIPQLAAVLSGGRVSASCRSLLFVRLTIQTPQFKDELHDLESRSANLRSVPYRMKHRLSQNALRTSDMWPGSPEPHQELRISNCGLRIADLCCDECLSGLARNSRIKNCEFRIADCEFCLRRNVYLAWLARAASRIANFELRIADFVCAEMFIWLGSPEPHHKLAIRNPQSEIRNSCGRMPIDDCRLAFAIR